MNGTNSKRNGFCKMDINVTIKIDSYQDDTKRLLQVLRPNWAENEICFKMFSGGITNKLFVAYLCSDFDKIDGINIRIYGAGSEHVIDRDAEISAIHALNIAGCGTQLYARFNNGVAYQYLCGETLDEKTVRDPKIGRMVARRMLDMHQIDEQFLQKHEIPFSTQPMVFKRMHQWLDHIPNEYKDPHVNERFKEDLPTVHEFRNELKQLEMHLDSVRSPVVFGHNDILLKNILHDSSKGVINFIDYEYASFTYEAFDIGNHFCEWAGVDVVDYTLYPDKTTQLPWLKAYLEEKKKIKEESDVTDHHIETLYVQVNKFALAAHFHWALWALLQAKYSQIDFDYMGYAIERYNEYLAKKESFFALEVPV